MIHYALRCGGGHQFDGWFNSSAGFDAQATRGLLECPVCADTAVERAIMAPRLNRGAAAPAEPQQPKPAAPEIPPGTTPQTPAQTIAPPPAVPDQVRAVLQRIRTEVEKNCDYVGEKFATTARRMHDGAEPHRPIYGESTPEEAAALAEDGIEISRIPWVPRADS
jgi:hypothetical protein